jgi:hypothetical protein
MVPTDGLVGVSGWGFITTSADWPDVQPKEFVTVNRYVPSSRFENVVLAPVPVMVTEPGLLVIVHVPVSGKPCSTTLPVDNSQVGWVIVPITGAVGIGGCEFITTSPEGSDVHPLPLVTVKV